MDDVTNALAVVLSRLKKVGIVSFDSFERNQFLAKKRFICQEVAENNRFTILWSLNPLGTDCDQKVQNWDTFL